MHNFWVFLTGVGVGVGLMVIVILALMCHVMDDECDLEAEE